MSTAVIDIELVPEYTTLVVPVEKIIDVMPAPDPIIEVIVPPAVPLSVDVLAPPEPVVEIIAPPSFTLEITALVLPTVEVVTPPEMTMDVVVGGESSGGGGEPLPTADLGQVLISQGDGVSPIFSPSPALTSLLLGTNPAQSGAIRLANGNEIRWRNTGNSNDSAYISYATWLNVVNNEAPLWLQGKQSIYFSAETVQTVALFAYGAFYPGADGLINLGYAGNGRWGTALLKDAVIIGDNPAQIGAIRLANNQWIAARNSVNSTDIGMLLLSGDNGTVLHGTYINLQSDISPAGLYLYDAAFWPSAHGVLDLGRSTERFKDLWLSGQMTAASLGSTPLNAANLTGTIADARLSANVPLKNADNVYSGFNGFDGAVQFTNVFYVTKPDAHIIMNDTSRPVDGRVFALYNTQGEWFFTAYSDAMVGQSYPLRLQRNGNALVGNILTAPGGLGSTPLNADNLSSGAVPNARLSIDVLKHTGGYPGGSNFLRSDGIFAPATGTAGPAGPEGPQGPIGPEGPKGDTGDSGPQGIQGIPGNTGPTGATGADGPQGPQGVKGDTGNTGATGPEGPQGDQGIQGIQGIQGNTGNTGNTGAPGEKWFTGAGAPAGSLAGSIVGDWYLDTSTGDYYEKTGASAWTNRGNLKGPKGDTGTTGAQGNPGITEPFRLGHTWGLVGDLTGLTAVPSLFIPMMGTQASALYGIRTKIGSGTSVGVQVKRNGANVGTVITVTTTAAFTSLGNVALADNDDLTIVLSAHTGAPTNLSATLIVEHTP